MTGVVDQRKGVKKQGICHRAFQNQPRNSLKKEEWLRSACAGEPPAPQNWQD
jgi:hypothetical protein